MRHCLKVISIISICAFLIACSKKETGIDPGVPPPLVISVSPIENGTDVPVDAVVSATFSKPIDSTTIDQSSFMLFLLDVQVIGATGYADKVATFRPSLNLENNKVYTATITTGVTDNLGIPLSSAKTWQFTTTPGLIMPLAVGNWWEYQQNIYDVPGGVPGLPTYDTIRIVRDTTIASEKWYIDNFGNVMTHRADGLWKISKLNQMYLYIQFPATLNDSYNGNPDSAQTMEVTSLGVSKVMPAGNFYICHEYTERYSNQTDIEILNYYKPNLGLVSWEKYDRELPDVGITQTRQLLHFNIQ